MNDVRETYNGYDIFFDEKTEEWYAHVTPEGKNAESHSEDERVENASLKKLKELLDMIKRKKFERKTVFVRSSKSRYLSGNEKKYVPQYAEATMTSVAPNGNAYVVEKGSKHADKYSLNWHYDRIYLDTPENREIIAEIERQGEIEQKAKNEGERLEKTLKSVDGKKLYKEVYGKDLKD